MTIEVPQETQRRNFVESQRKADFDKWSRRVLYPALGALISLEIAIFVSAWGVSSYARVALIVSLASIVLTLIAVAGAFSTRRAMSILTTASIVTSITASRAASVQEDQSPVLLRALEVFGDSDRALAWMREQNPALNNETPLHAIQCEEGRVGVLNILGRIEHGVIS
jgi:uncharacterized protein (DUF2384 family)